MDTVLIVEDEQPIRTMVNYALTRAGYELIEVENATQAKAEIAKKHPDIILMDWMLPGQNGVELTRRLKREVTTQRIPVIMLTAMTDTDDKIAGLNAGADDYISKPFSPSELIARIQAVLRRAKPHEKSDNIITCNELTLDPTSHRVTAGDTELNLGPTEFRLLKFFMQHPDRVFNREQLLDHAWGHNVYVEERTVDVHILRLRKNLQPHGFDNYIQTVRGAGYRFTVSSSAAQ